MDDERFKFITVLYRKEEMYGFIVPDIVIALASGMAGWIFMNILPFFIGILAILVLRNFRMNKPKGYCIHLLYHYGYYNPLKTIPPGKKICPFLFE